MKKDVGIDHKEESAAATGRKRKRKLQLLEMGAE
jgi:hypothetical protein